MKSPILNTKQGEYYPHPGQHERVEREEEIQWLPYYLLPSRMQVPGLPPIPTLPFCFMVCQGDGGANYRARFVCAGCFGNSRRGRKKVKFGGGVCETCHTTANIPHPAGPGPSDADLE